MYTSTVYMYTVHVQCTCVYTLCIHEHVCIYMYFRGIFTFDASDVLKSMSQDNLAKSGQQGLSYTEVGITRRRRRDLDKR